MTRILVIDDDTMVLESLKLALEDEGYQVFTAQNGQEGMESARREKPDLVTLDITMPEASGTRFYKEIRQDPELSTVPVIIVTAVTGYGGDPEPFENFISTRKQVPAPEAFFSKPIDRDELLKVIKGLLS